MTLRVVEARADEPAGPDNRETIRDGALSVFAAKGFAGCTVPDIARAAGVATGTIYRYFPSKEALVNEVYRHWKQRLAEAVLPVGAGDQPSSREVFDRLWSGLSRFVREHPEAFGFLEMHHHEPYLDAESRGVSLAFEAAVLEAIVVGQQRGEIRPGEPAVLAALVYGAFTGVVRAHDLWPELIDDEAIAAAGSDAWRLLATTD